LQNITFLNALRLSNWVPVNAGADAEPVGVTGVPVKVGAEFEPFAVTVWVCVPSADPEKVGTAAGQEIVSAGIVPEVPVNAGTPTGQEIVPAGVKLTVELVGTPAGQERTCV
jgi:hypothetical protein